jgi:hypothetical protein
MHRLACSAVGLHVVFAAFVGGLRFRWPPLPQNDPLPSSPALDRENASLYA